MNTPHRFSLIELLIVIAIIGILTTLLIPQFNNVDTDAADKVAEYNAVAFANQMVTYRTLNKAFPSKLHTGLTHNNATNNPLDNFTTVVRENLIQKTESIPLTSMALSLRNAGMYRVLFGVDTEGVITENTTHIYSIKDDWFSECAVNGTTLSKPIQIGGLTLREWLDIGAAGTASDKFFIAPFFIDDAAQWSVIYDTAGIPSVLSQIKMKEFKDPRKTFTTGKTFNPIVLIKVFETNRPAELLGIITVSNDGYKLEVHK